MKMNTEIEYDEFSNLTDIQKFFYGQNVFLTGVTGLVGKVIFILCMINICSFPQKTLLCLLMKKPLFYMTEIRN